MAKSGTHFQFKQFTVYHDRCTMKVGTDGVLLGAWVHLDHAERILDIGSGSGLIALMLAQRSGNHAKIDAVEVEREDAMQSRENIARSPWPDQITVHHKPIQEHQPDYRYDLIVSNPPYFNNSQQPPDPRRHITRHTEALRYGDLLDAVKRLLAPPGKFNVILPTTEGNQFVALALSAGLFCTRQWNFRTREGKPVERVLLEFSFNERQPASGEVLLYREGDNWSEGYEALTREFYLKIK